MPHGHRRAAQIGQSQPRDRLTSAWLLSAAGDRPEAARAADAKCRRSARRPGVGAGGGSDRPLDDRCKPKPGRLRRGELALHTPGECRSRPRRDRFSACSFRTVRKHPRAPVGPLRPRCARARTATCRAHVGSQSPDRRPTRRVGPDSRISPHREMQKLGSTTGATSDSPSPPERRRTLTQGPRYARESRPRSDRAQLTRAR